MGNAGVISETALRRAGLHSIAAGPQSLPLTARPLTGQPYCLDGVSPHETGWVRQFRCLKSMIWRVLRGSHAQVYRRTRQERMPGALVRRARFHPDHDGPVCRPQLDPNLHALGSWVVADHVVPDPLIAGPGG